MRFFATTSALCAGIYVIAGLSGPAAADGVELSRESVAQQIDVAGRQRMLTQRMAKSFCYAMSGIDTDRNLAVLDGARDLYRASHVGLRRGSVEMGLYEETSARVIEIWEDVDLHWIDTDETLNNAIEAGIATDAQFEDVITATLSMLGLNNDLVGQIRASHTGDMGGASGVGAALLIDVYGRQRMLSQKLSKEVCLANRGYRTDETRAALAETFQIFDTTLNAFIDGMPSVGIPPAPTDEIRAKLLEAKAKWDPVKPVAASVLDGEEVAQSDLVAFSGSMDAFLVLMNEAVGMLVAHEAGRS